MIVKMASKLLKIEIVRRFIKYGTVGGTVFVIHTSVLWFLLRILQMGNIIAITVAYVIALVCHFSMNNFFTFSESNALYRKRIVGYAMAVIAHYLLSTTIINTVLTFLVDNVLVATITSSSVSMIFFFFVLNRFVFTRGGEKLEQAE